MTGHIRCFRARPAAVWAAVIAFGFAAMMFAAAGLAATDPPPAAPGAQPAAEAAPPAAAQTAPAGVKHNASYYLSRITRQGKFIVVTKELAEDAIKDNEIVLSSVAIKTRVGKDGKLAGYELFEIDKGSIPEKIGFKSGDRVTAVNGIAARDLEKNRASLQSAGRFEITVYRKGKARKIFVEVRGAGK